MPTLASLFKEVKGTGGRPRKGERLEQDFPASRVRVRIQGHVPVLWSRALSSMSSALCPLTVPGGKWAFTELLWPRSSNEPRHAFLLWAFVSSQEQTFKEPCTADILHL